MFFLCQKFYVTLECNNKEEIKRKTQTMLRELCVSCVTIAQANGSLPNCFLKHGGKKGMKKELWLKIFATMSGFS